MHPSFFIQYNKFPLSTTVNQIKKNRSRWGEGVMIYQEIFKKKKSLFSPQFFEDAKTSKKAFKKGIHPPISCHGSPNYWRQLRESDVRWRLYKEHYHKNNKHHPLYFPQCITNENGFHIEDANIWKKRNYEGVNGGVISGASSRWRRRLVFI